MWYLLFTFIRCILLCSNVIWRWWVCHKQSAFEPSDLRCCLCAPPPQFRRRGRSRARLSMRLRSSCVGADISSSHRINCSRKLCVNLPKWMWSAGRLRLLTRWMANTIPLKIISNFATIRSSIRLRMAGMLAVLAGRCVCGCCVRCVPFGCWLGNVRYDRRVSCSTTCVGYCFVCAYLLSVECHRFSVVLYIQGIELRGCTLVTLRTNYDHHHHHHPCMYIISSIIVIDWISLRFIWRSKCD